MGIPPEHASLVNEWTATIDEAVASLAQETAARAEQAGIEAGATAEEVPERPELGERLRKDLADELVMGAVAFWATGIPQVVIRLLPHLILWWVGRRATRPKRSKELTADDALSAQRLLEIDGHFFATMQRASQEPSSPRTVNELSNVREEYAALLDADLPSYLVAPARRSLADASERLAMARASRGETEEAAREYVAAEGAWEQVGDEASAERCRVERGELS